jgi:hypothetical protein
VDKAGARQDSTGERLAVVPTADDDSQLMAKSKTREKSFIGSLIYFHSFFPVFVQRTSKNLKEP